MCRDNSIVVLDAAGTDLTGSVMGGVNGMLAEMDRDSTVARLAAGKAFWRGKKRLEGQYHYGSILFENTMPNGLWSRELQRCIFP